MKWWWGWWWCWCRRCGDCGDGDCGKENVGDGDVGGENVESGIGGGRVSGGDVGGDVGTWGRWWWGRGDVGGGTLVGTLGAIGGGRLKAADGVAAGVWEGSCETLLARMEACAVVPVQQCAEDV